jgi:acyl-CoA dehydrogenase
MIVRPAFRTPPASETVAQRLAPALAAAAAAADAVDREGRFPREAIEALRQARLLGAMTPRECGGSAMSFTEIADIISQLGAVCSSAGMVYAMHQIKVSSLVTHGQNSPWHRNFMRRIARDELLLASATTEAGIGGDLRNSICAVERDGDIAMIEKDASVISYASEADAILVTARRAPDAASSDQVMVVVEKSQATLERTTVWDTLGMRGTCSDGFKLSARVPEAQVFPEPFAEIAAESMLAASHLFWAALWFGIASGALAKAQAFVKVQAKRTPGAPPPTAARLAAAAAELEALRALVRDGLARYEVAKADPDLLGSMGFATAINALKVIASEKAVAVTQAALGIVGIAGYKNDTPFSVGRPMRDILSAPLMIANDRILANTAPMMLVARLDARLGA